MPAGTTTPASDIEYILGDFLIHPFTAASFDFIASVAALHHTKSYWEHSAPKIWTAPETYARIRRSAERALPGARYRRHLLWRYSLTWTKPPCAAREP